MYFKENLQAFIHGCAIASVLALAYSTIPELSRQSGFKNHGPFRYFQTASPVIITTALATHNGSIVWASFTGDIGLQILK